MTTYGFPLFLEDTTGHINGSNYADIYDRRPYLHLAVFAYSDRIVRQIYRMDSKPSRLRYSSSQLPSPTVTLEFGLNHALGTITFACSNPRSMEQYLRKESIHGSSLVRRFRGSDGIEYTWTPRNNHTEWSCANSATQDIIGSYDLKPPNEPTYRTASGKITSGNVLTVYERFQYLTIELLATLTIMRHIAEHDL